MKNIINKIVTPFGYLGWGIFIYSIFLEIGNHISEFKSPKIESYTHLEQLVDEKKKEIGFTDSVEAVIDLTNFTAKSYKRDRNSYVIVIPKDDLNKAMLEHEFYHISQGHCEDTGPDGHFKGFGNKLKYLFYYEPKTIIHTLKHKN